MPEETVTTTTSVEATAAERATAAADQAAASAAALTQQATDAASQRIAEFEGRVSKWETDLSSLSETVRANSSGLTELQAQSAQATTELRGLLESIQSKLAPPPAPPPPSLEQPPSPGDGNPPPAPEPSPPPVARKAHRWI